MGRAQAAGMYLKEALCSFLSSPALRAIKTLHTSLRLKHQERRVLGAHSNPLPECTALTGGLDFLSKVTKPCIKKSISERS